MDELVENLFDVTATSDDLASLAPPAGCAEARRTEGHDDFEYPAGYTLCAVDSGAVLIGLVSGELAGLTGVQASDRLFETAVQSSDSDASPAATA